MILLASSPANPKALKGTKSATSMSTNPQELLEEQDSIRVKKFRKKESKVLQERVGMQKTTNANNSSNSTPRSLNNANLTFQTLNFLRIN
jgi:hypothetical protein